MALRDLRAETETVSFWSRNPGWVLGEGYLMTPPKTYAERLTSAADNLAVFIAEVEDYVPNIAGWQFRIPWKIIETSKDTYNGIDMVGALLDGLGDYNGGQGLKNNYGQRIRIVFFVEAAGFEANVFEVPTYLKNEGQWQYNANKTVASGSGYDVKDAKWRIYSQERLYDVYKKIIDTYGNHPHFGGIQTNETAGAYKDTNIKPESPVRPDLSVEALRYSFSYLMKKLCSISNPADAPSYFFQNYWSIGNGKQQLNETVVDLRPYRYIMSGPDMFPDGVINDSTGPGDSTPGDVGPGVVSGVKPRYQFNNDGTLWKAGSFQHASHDAATLDPNFPDNYYTMNSMFLACVLGADEFGTPDDGFHVQTLFCNTTRTGHKAYNAWKDLSLPRTNSRDTCQKSLKSAAQGGFGDSLPWQDFDWPKKPT